MFQTLICSYNKLINSKELRLSITLKLYEYRFQISQDSQIHFFHIFLHLLPKMLHNRRHFSYFINYLIPSSVDVENCSVFKILRIFQASNFRELWKRILDLAIGVELYITEPSRRLDNNRSLYILKSGNKDEFIDLCLIGV